VKVVTPTTLVSEAAEVLAPVHDTVVVVGAAAIEIALADAQTTITPTRDVDVVVATEQARTVIAHLEGAGLKRSDQPHEAAFTWVLGDLKVQLVRGFHPFPPAEARRLPQNPVFAIATESTHQIDVAFADAPTVRRLRAANAACLLALKHAAFGRRRAESDVIVRRDYHDAFLLIDAAADDIISQREAASHEVQSRTLAASADLAAGADATVAAAREIVSLDPATSQRAAEALVQRTALRLQRRLDNETTST
jgi:hypothetical protein